MSSVTSSRMIVFCKYLALLALGLGASEGFQLFQASTRVSPISCDPNTSGRRQFVGSMLVAAGGFAFGGQSVNAAEESSSNGVIKPYAKLDDLLPAARVKRVIDRSVELTSDMVANDSNKQTTIPVLEGLLLQPQNFTGSRGVSEVPTKPAEQYLKSYKKTRDDLPLLAKPGAMLVQDGDIRAWKRLKAGEQARERQDEVRAALNAYTNGLSFDADRYLLTAPKDVRKKLIREDQIPDIKSVITSDLGMRYLVRNEVLSAMDEVRAEMRYQLEASDGPFDAVELLERLKVAQSALDRWFAFIEESDVSEALAALEKEEPMM